MMLDERDAERIAEYGAERHDSIYVSSPDPARRNSDACLYKLRYLSDLQLANLSNKMFQEAHHI